MQGVPPDMDETMVAALVSEHAPVVNVRLIRERGSKISRGFGFIVRPSRPPAHYHALHIRSMRCSRGVGSEGIQA